MIKAQLNLILILSVNHGLCFTHTLRLMHNYEISKLKMSKTSRKKTGRVISSLTADHSRLKIVELLESQFKYRGRGLPFKKNRGARRIF